MEKNGRSSGVMLVTSSKYVVSLKPEVKLFLGYCLRISLHLSLNWASRALRCDFGFCYFMMIDVIIIRFCYH